MKTRLLLPLLSLLAACATTAPSGVREDFDMPEEVSSWQQAQEDSSCVVLLCAQERCASWRCRDVEIEPPESGQVVLTRGSLTQPPGFTYARSRWWGHPLAVPSRFSDPVFEIPWHNWRSHTRNDAKKLEAICIPAPEPMEKHHIFPQASDLAQWFRLKGLEIHDFTIVIPRSFHAYLHSGGPRGGMWNEAWRQFRDQNRNATVEDLWRFAFELMHRYRLIGELIPYCK